MLCINLNIFDENAIKILKQSLLGLKTTETTTEYVVDDETGKLKILKQKVNEKKLPPNNDLLKLVYQHFTKDEMDYDELSDEDLENEKQRLLIELKEIKNGCGKSKTKS